MAYEGPIQELIDELARLPGVGPKSAQRLAFWLVKAPAEDAKRLAAAIVQNSDGLFSVKPFPQTIYAFAAVLLVSEDLDEILELADRVAVMSGGTINYVAPVGETDRATIGKHMAGH